MGVYLLERLKQTEHEVYVTSRSGHPDEGNIHYIEGNAKDDDFLLPLLANGYDCIIDFMVYSTFEFVDRYKQLLAAAIYFPFFLPGLCRQRAGANYGRKSAASGRGQRRQIPED